MNKFLLIFVSLFLCCNSAFSEIKAVVFDYGGVMTKVVNKKIVKEYIRDTLKLTDEEMNNVIYEFKKSKEPESVFYPKIAKKKNVILDKDWYEGLEKRYVLSIILNEEMVQIVNDLKKNGYVVGMLSNIEKKQSEMVDELGHYKYFNPIILSCDINVSKPNKKAYDILIQRIDLKPDEILFIDDRIENVNAAKEDSIDAIHFKGVNSFKEELRNRNIKF